MSDSMLDRLAERLDQCGRSSVPLAEVPALLRDGRGAPSLTVIEERLGRDERFRVLDAAPPLPDLESCPPRVRAAYADAFRRAGLLSVRIVVLVARQSAGGPPLVDLVRETLACLIPFDAPALTGYGLGDEARRLLDALTTADAADRSTTPLPGPPPP